MTKILLTHPIPKAGIDLLKKEGYSVTVYHGAPFISKNELKKIVKGYDGIISMLTHGIDAEIMDSAGKQLRVISNFSSGYDNVDLGAAKKRGVVVTHTSCPEISDSVANHTVALVFSLVHKIVEADMFMRAGKYKGWDPELFLRQDMRGKVFGLIGLGRIGKMVAERMKFFGMNVIYSDIKRDELFEKELKIQYKKLDEVLSQSDIISLHAPLLPSTRHCINSKTLKKMKKGALLINAARGPLVDEKAVAQSLKLKKLGGYATDVYECEPKFTCDPKKYNLSKLPNTVLTPHIASATYTVRNAMARMAAQNSIDVLKNKKCPNQVLF